MCVIKDVLCSIKFTEVNGDKFLFCKLTLTSCKVANSFL